jgi:hypothetical protein
MLFESTSELTVLGPTDGVASGSRHSDFTPVTFGLSRQADNFKANAPLLGHVRSRAHHGLKSDIAPCPKSADIGSGRNESAAAGRLNYAAANVA